MIRIQRFELWRQLSVWPEAGFVCFGTTTSVPNLAPFGSRRKLFGNNPIVWTFPRRDQPPIVLDMAMTRSSGKGARARSEGNDIPESRNFRRDSNPIDPDVAMKLFRRSVAARNRLITASNILAGILSGSAHTGEVAVGHRGQFFLLMDPSILEKKTTITMIENMVDQIALGKRCSAGTGVSARRGAANYGPSFSTGVVYPGQSITPSGRRC